MLVRMRAILVLACACAFVAPPRRMCEPTALMARKQRKKKGPTRGGADKKRQKPAESGGGGGDGAAPAFPTAAPFEALPNAAAVEPAAAPPPVAVAPPVAEAAPVEAEVAPAVAKAAALEAQRSADAFADALAAAPAVDDGDSAVDLIVDEPGKLFGKSVEAKLEARAKSGGGRKRKAPPPPAAVEEPSALLPDLKLPDLPNFPNPLLDFDAKDVAEKVGGARPESPNDGFDYGVGGIVKKAVYALGAAAILWEVYINSPLFERQAEPPAIAAMKSEMAKYEPPMKSARDAEDTDRSLTDEDIANAEKSGRGLGGFGLGFNKPPSPP